MQQNIFVKLYNNIIADKTADNVAMRFLNIEKMSEPKLQKLCYYTYCWLIAISNDKDINDSDIIIPWNERFQAWIHGPVLPSLYHKYNRYIDVSTQNPILPNVEEIVVEKIWGRYGQYTDEELETISRNEKPYLIAREGLYVGDACTNEILPYNILKHFTITRKEV